MRFCIRISAWHASELRLRCLFSAASVYYRQSIRRIAHKYSTYKAMSKCHMDTEWGIFDMKKGRDTLCGIVLFP